jgi:phosphate starvation-inducible PhoH-like protein
MKRKIFLRDIDPIMFAGTEDQNMKLIENNFNSKIVLRGNELHLDGNKNELDNLESLVNDIVFTINQKGFIDNKDIDILINSSSLKNIEIDNNKSDTIILYTPKGIVGPKTSGQKKYYKAVLKNDIVFAIGPAGSGKTYQAVACGVSALKNNEVEKIVITRPVVEAGENLGFLPGDLKDKVDPYLTPLYDALYKMVEKDKLKMYLDQKIIEIAPLAYMRGRTLHNSFMILDEAQNCTKMQMKMFLTRLGVTSKAIITGDITQTDLGKNEISGLVDASNVLKKIKGISFIELDESDIVRHKLVKDIIKAYKKETK